VANRCNLIASLETGAGLSSEMLREGTWETSQNNASSADKLF